MKTTQLPDDISFERWVLHVFDHPLPDDPLAQDWYFRLDAEFWDAQAQPARTIRYITQLFRAMDTLTAPYSDGQIALGINYLISNACSNHMFPLMDAGMPLADRLACVESFYDVYVKLYAKKCTPDLGHLMVNEQQGNPLNMTCYMWWDIIPFYGKCGDAREQLDATMLDVMAKTLEIDHDACREGALHGLGHWHSAYPAFVEGVIDRFLANHPKLSPELLSYAKAARLGCIQ